MCQDSHAYRLNLTPRYFSDSLVPVNWTEVPLNDLGGQQVRAYLGPLIPDEKP